MPFTNPIVGGNGSLILPAIRSPNYVTNVSGWTINRDGSAEFADLIITGGEIRVTDPDGSYVRIFDEDPGNGAVIHFQPATVGGATITPAQIISGSSSGPATAFLQIIGPNVNGAGFGFIDLRSNSAGLELNTYAADVHRFTTKLQLFSPTSSDYRTLGFEECLVNQTPPPATTTTSAVFVDIAGGSTGTFQKEYAETDIALSMGMGMFATAGGTVGQFALNLSGVGDQTMGQVLLSAPSTENAPSTVKRVTGVPAGTYTLTPRWRRVSGAGTLTITASSGTLSYSAREIIQP